MTPEQKRIENQREEIRRLRKRLNDITQSRNAWKTRAKRLGKLLNDLQQKGTNDDGAENT